jgi:hypothetical protein
MAPGPASPSWIVRHRWPLGITALAIATRVLWTVIIHPPSQFIYSDMAAYVARAQRLAADPGGGPWGDEVFFPWGTHYLLAALLRLFGATIEAKSVAVAWGLLNAAIAPLAYFMAGRLHGGPSWSREEHGVGQTMSAASAEERGLTNATARAAGALLVIYYPVIAYAGYFLSESPFALCLTLTAFLGLRLVDHGRVRDAALFGIVAAVGFAVRSQIAAGLALLFVFAVARRSLFPARLGWRHLAAVALPLALVAGYSSWLSNEHTQKLSPVPQNNALNRAFGRCHAYEISSRDASFGPPAFGALYRNELKDPNALIKLAPAIKDKLHVKGRMSDQQLLNGLADECTEKTTFRRQAYYAATHVILLWGYHVAWPDMALPIFKRHMRGWTRAHLIAFCAPCLVGMAMGVHRRWPRHGILGLLLWSMLAVMMLYMGEVRMRIPYDTLSIVLALDVYARAALLISAWWRARRQSGVQA